MARQYFSGGTCFAPWQEQCPHPPLALARPLFCFVLKMFKLTMEQRNLTLTGFLLKHYVVPNTRVLTLNSRVTVKRFDLLFLYFLFPRHLLWHWCAWTLPSSGTRMLHHFLQQIIQQQGTRAFLSRLCFCMWQIYSTLLCVSVQLCATSKPFIYHHINIICTYALFTACIAL